MNIMKGSISYMQIHDMMWIISWMDDAFHFILKLQLIGFLIIIGRIYTGYEGPGFNVSYMGPGAMTFRAASVGRHMPYGRD